MKPNAITREELLKGVLRNYARFYMWKILEYWFVADPFKRRYLLGCLWAFLKTTLNKRFYNLKRVKQKGFHTEIDFGFDESRILTHEQIVQRNQKLGADVNFAGTLKETNPITISACGAPSELPAYQPEEQHSEIQVLLIISEEQQRVSLRKALRGETGIDIYSEATNAETGLVLLTSVAGADVALIDFNLPDKNAVELTKEFREVQAESDNPRLKLCLFLEPDAEEQILASFAAGAESYILKNASIEQLAEAIRLTQAGYLYLDPVIANLIFSKVKDIKGEAILTETELAVLELIAIGTDYEAVASSLQIEPETVNSHIANIIDRVCISDLTQKSVKALNLV
jgi:anaerobic magnesium-protoporphyrin IX monomethyl ester cyclase